MIKRFQIGIFGLSGQKRKIVGAKWVEDHLFCAYLLAARAKKERFFEIYGI